jgi:hypothetical protein
MYLGNDIESFFCILLRTLQVPGKERVIGDFELLHVREEITRSDYNFLLVKHMVEYYVPLSRCLDCIEINPHLQN